MPGKADGKDLVFCGTVIHSTEEEPLKIHENAILGVKSGKVVFLDKRDNLTQCLREHELDSECVVTLSDRQLVMPGLVDCHLHSSQLCMLGQGTDLGLLDWLHKYTFPSEHRFHEPQFADMAHHKAVARTLRNGTTSACYFSTIHTDGALLLCRAADELGQRALVGKVNMDMEAPDYYVETTEQSLEETERFIREALALKSSLVTPVVTPRFAVSCSKELMTQLAHLAHKWDLPVQTHLNESQNEISVVMKLHPGHQTYSDVYDSAGLLGSKTILAHCVHMSDRDLHILKTRDCGLVHCACSNNTLRSGVADLRRLTDHGIKVGLGTDIGAGFTPSMLDTMRHSVTASNVCAITRQPQRKQTDVTPETGLSNGETSQTDTDASSYAPLSMAEVFRLATLGGSSVLNQNCGNFEVGREFDALIIDPEVKDTPLDLFPFDQTDNIVRKFFYCGDDRNILDVYVQGRQVVSRRDA